MALCPVKYQFVSHSYEYDTCMSTVLYSSTVSLLALFSLVQVAPKFRVYGMYIYRYSVMHCEEPKSSKGV